MKSVKTFRATIYLGAKEHYDGITHNFDEINAWLRTYCNEKSFCVTLKETKFIYKDGEEPGFEIGIINYPRFPRHEYDLRDAALEIAWELKFLFNQYRVSVVCTNETYLLEDYNE